MIIPDDSWVPVVPAATSSPSDRDPELYLAVLRQFPLETHIRWKRGHADAHETYCNIYVWDCTSALGCEIPHWVDKGNPVKVGMGRELSANGISNWLIEHGSRFGWTEASADTARAHAAEGRPVVVVRANPKGIGHVAMLLPNGNIAQAGSKNFFDKPIAAGFGKRPVKFYVHA